MVFNFVSWIFWTFCSRYYLNLDACWGESIKGSESLREVWGISCFMDSFGKKQVYLIKIKFGAK